VEVPELELQPVIAQTAIELGILTVAIVTLPFWFEGQKRWDQAVEGIKNLKDNVDALLIIITTASDIYGDQKLSVASVRQIMFWPWLPRYR
jgi:cell division protein FtsZ